MITGLLFSTCFAYAQDGGKMKTDKMSYGSKMTDGKMTKGGKMSHKSKMSKEKMAKDKM